MQDLASGGGGIHTGGGIHKGIHTVHHKGSNGGEGQADPLPPFQQCFKNSMNNINLSADVLNDFRKESLA